MWPAVRNIVYTCQTFTHSCSNVMNQQIRNTHILKRKFEPRLHKKNMKPKPLRSKNFVYEWIKDTSVEKQPLLNLILTVNVEGLGNRGDIVEAKANYAYNNLILLQKAVYANEENIEKFASLRNETEDKPSTPFVPLLMGSLSRMTLSVVMNKELPWTLKPWHIRTSFRKCGWEIPERCLILPEKPITGPNMNLENKEFIITVEFTPKERQEVKCRIHHWSTDPSDRLTYVPEFWKIPTESVFVEEVQNTEKPENM